MPAKSGKLRGAGLGRAKARQLGSPRAAHLTELPRLAELIFATNKSLQVALRDRNCLEASGKYTHLQRLLGRFDAETSAANFPRGARQYEREQVRRIREHAFGQFFSCVRDTKTER